LRRIVVIEGAKVAELSSYEISLLKQLMVAGVNGRSIENLASGSLTRLTKAGYVTIRAGNAKTTLFVISPRGLQALAVAAGNEP
jgi:hypothetical protein